MFNSHFRSLTESVQLTLHKAANAIDFGADSTENTFAIDFPLIAQCNVWQARPPFEWQDLTGNSLPHTGILWLFQAPFKWRLPINSLILQLLCGSRFTCDQILISNFATLAKQKIRLVARSTMEFLPLDNDILRI